MKKIFFIVIALVVFSCGKDDPTPTPVQSTPPTPTTPPAMPPSSDGIGTGLTSGAFVSAPGESTKGSASIEDNGGSKSLILDKNFMASGPDLKVYLSADANASDYKSLGSLKASSGMQSYPISSSIDLTKYKFVVIWCQQYSVRFGTAELK